MPFSLNADELATLHTLAPLCPRELLGPDGYPDPRPLPDDMPSPAFLWLVALLAKRRNANPWGAAWTGGPRKSWELWQVQGRVQGFPFLDLPSTGAFVFGREVPTEGTRENAVRALIRALAG